jgi:hypothetical protein
MNISPKCSGTDTGTLRTPELLHHAPAASPLAAWQALLLLLVLLLVPRPCPRQPLLLLLLLVLLLGVS